MSKSARAGIPFVGIVFLLLAGLKLMQGDDWVVWAILGVLFGGFGVFGLSRSAEDAR